MVMQIALAALVAALILLVEHWFPWQLAIRRKLPNLIAYVLGLSGLLAPLTVLFNYWIYDPPEFTYAHIVALWVISSAGGLAVSLAHLIDWMLKQYAALRELKELLEQKNAHH